MALDARTRSSIYGKLVPVLGDDDANALMSEFPSVEADELVTKHFLRAELAGVRAEIGALRSELRSEIAAMASELRSEIAASNHELRADTSSLGVSLRGEIADLRVDMVERFQRQTTWVVGTVVGTAAVIVASIPLLS